MSAISEGRRRRRHPTPRPDDPRVIRTRAAVVEAARTLFLRRGYAATTMDDIATMAGLTKRTVYNNYGDKEALFTQIVADVIVLAEAFADDVHEEFAGSITNANLHPALHALAERLALGIMRPEVVALRRLLVAESRTFPALARRYFDRAPGRVIDALASGFRRLDRARVLGIPDARRAAAQFAYLAAGEALDRAVLVGTIPPRPAIVSAARDGVDTFLARYGPGRPNATRRPRPRRATPGPR